MRKTKIVGFECVIGRNLDGDIICTHYLEENKNIKSKNNTQMNEKRQKISPNGQKGINLRRKSQKCKIYRVWQEERKYGVL